VKQNDTVTEQDDEVENIQNPVQAKVDPDNNSQEQVEAKVDPDNNSQEQVLLLLEILNT